MKSKYIVLCMAGWLLACSSCKKFLDQQPYSQATDQTTWKSEADANSSVAGCYSLIRSALNTSITFYTYGDLISGEFSGIVGGDYAYLDVLNVNWGIGIPSANTYDPRMKLRLWTNFYTAIAQSNRCLQYIANMPVTVFSGEDAAAKQATQKRYLGEAYFTRAFNYFYIARVWGDAPVITTASDSSITQQLPRLPQAEVLKQAIADANKAVEYLNWKDNSSADRAVRADKGAAFALLAHIYAWIGDYDNCSKACDSVINSGSYNLAGAADYMNIYKGQSAESIFEISQNSSSESMRATDANAITGVTLASPYLGNSLQQPSWQMNTGLVAGLFSDTNDVRYQKAFAKIATGSINTYQCIKYANIQNINNNTAYQVAVNNIIVFRLADIELLKAEALAAKAAPDYAGALSLVNAIRAVRNVAPLNGLTGADLLQTIADERGRELFLEGHRTFDLIRLERLTGEQQFDNITPAEFTAGKYYWPIDPTLFNNNSKLTQTAFWVGKVK